MNYRRRSRELALKALCQCDALNDWQQSCVATFFAHFGEVDTEQDLPVSSEVLAYAKELVAGVLQHKSEIDQHIRSASEHWELTRMAWVDRNILRLSVYEVMYQQEIPWKVCIDEAIELAKTYSGDESHHFVNALLDHLALEFQAKNENDAAKKNAANS